MQRQLKSWISRILSKRGAFGRAQPVHRRPRTTLCLEGLEDRTAPAVFIVNTLTDTAAATGQGAGSGNSGDLRYCITQANQNPSNSNPYGNDILFGVSGLIDLARAGPPVGNE